MAQTYQTSITVARPATLGGGNWTLSKLTGITVVFGKNGSGKSLLLRAWRDTDNVGSHYVVPERTGELSYEAHFLLQQLDPKERQANSRQNFVERYRSQIVARVHAYFTTRGNVRSDQLPGDPGELEQLVSTLIPDFSIELNPTRNPPYKLTRSSDGKPVANIHALSSGEAQLITIALDALTIAAMWDMQGSAKRIMLIDEPDAHIHPDLQVRFADFLIRIAERFKLQVAIATHSTTLLAAIGQFGGENASVVYLDRLKSEFVAGRFTSMLKELAACLGGHALMGPLFGIPILLVEGDDDYRIWSQVPRHHVVSFAVIPSHGEEIRKYQRTLEGLFAVLRDPTTGLAGYALLDGDKPKPQDNAGTPQKHVRYIQLACHEAENLYLTDEVLETLGTDWKSAQAKIVQQAPKYLAKRAMLAGCGTWDRKTCDVKDVIDELSQILDAKSVHWTIRIAQVIGKARPEGQIAEFLGEDVISALWGTSIHDEAQDVVAPVITTA